MSRQDIVPTQGFCLLVSPGLFFPSSCPSWCQDTSKEPSPVPWLCLCLSSLGLDETPSPPGLFDLPSPSGQYRLLEQSYLFKNAPCQYLCSLQLAECSRAAWGVMEGQGERSSSKGLCWGRREQPLRSSADFPVLWGSGFLPVLVTLPPPSLKFFLSLLIPTVEGSGFPLGKGEDNHTLAMRPSVPFGSRTCFCY